MNKNRVFFAIIYAVLWKFFPELFLFFVPGIFLFERSVFWKDQPEFLKWWGVTNFISLAFWMVVLWLSAIPAIKMTLLFHLIAGGFFIYGLASPPTLRRPDKYSLGMLVLILTLLFVPFITRLGFLRGDMTMNMYTAKVITYYNGIPNTHEPFMAVPEFGQYALGTHVLTALFSMLSGLPIYTVALLLFCYIMHLLFLSFYYLIPDNNKRFLPAFGAVFFFFFFSHYPQFMFQWGSITTASGLAFGILLFPLLLNINKARALDIILLSLFCTAVPLSHFIPVFGFFLFFPPYYLVMRGIPDLDALKKVGAVALISLAFCAGQLTRMPPQPTGKWVKWSEGWNLMQFKSVQPLMEKIFSVQDITVLSIPFVYIFIFGPLTACLPFVLIRYVKDRQVKRLFLWSTLVAFMILLSKVHPFLPFNYALYPERVLVYAGIPMVLIYAHLTRNMSDKKVLITITAFLCLFTVTGLYIHKYDSKSYYRLLKEKNIGSAEMLALNLAGGDYIAYAFDDINSSLTEDDLDVMHWIKENIPVTELIECGYSEGGHLIPIVAGNKIIRPHYQHFWYDKYMLKWLEGKEAKYFFKSEKTFFSLDTLDLTIWEEVYRKGKAALYKRKKPAAAG